MSLNELVFEPNIIILGIFGSTNKISENDIQDNILNLILQELGRIPDRVLIPSEGNSSIYIQNWCEALRVKTQTFQSDWIRNGKIAQILRDDRIMKECTHALVFVSSTKQSQKLNRMEKLAEKMCKKGKVVFTSSHNQPLMQFEMSYCEPCQPKKALEHAHKSNTKIMQMWQKYQKKEEC